MEVNEESEPSPVFQAEKETQLYIDPKRAKVPKDWIWINTGEEGFYCAFIDWHFQFSTFIINKNFSEDLVISQYFIFYSLKHRLISDIT